VALEFQVYSLGILYASVCTSLPRDQVEKRMNEKSPTGVSSVVWKIADESFAKGEPNPHTCEVHPTHQHYLLSC
jgi:hypothetical protein